MQHPYKTYYYKTMAIVVKMKQKIQRQHPSARQRIHYYQQNDYPQRKLWQM